MSKLKAGDRIVGVGVIERDWREAGIASVHVLAVHPYSNVCRVQIESVHGCKREESWHLPHVLSAIDRFYRIERAGA